ncbi:MAG: response regulator [Kofleriaceae bacterium]
MGLQLPIAPGPGTNASDPGHGVLIVEDERIVAKDLQETLVAMGYDAFAIASSADEALRHASTRCPDLVLMDIRIKGARDGIETAKLLRERFGVPVVYLTAHADLATIERAKQTEPYGYLMKPVKSGELRSAIEISIYKHQAEQRHKRVQQQLELSDRLASFGAMVAGVAHEIHTPLAVIQANAAFVYEDLERQLAAGPQAPLDLTEILAAQADVDLAARRIARSVAGLQAFSRPQEPVGGHAGVEQASVLAETDVEPVAPPVPHGVTRPLRGRILAVDDEPMVLTTVARVLRDHEVVCVDDARAGLAMLERGDAFDLVLSDVMMPSMTGVELYERLLVTHPEIAQRVVFLTGGALTGRLRDFLAAVPNVLLHKPIGAEELREVVQRLLAAVQAGGPAALALQDRRAAHPR